MEALSKELLSEVFGFKVSGYCITDEYVEVWKNGKFSDGINIYKLAHKCKEKAREYGYSITSGYRGVSFHKNTQKWVSQIVVNRVHKNLGYFKTAIEAAIAYDHYVISNNLEHTKNF